MPLAIEMFFDNRTDAAVRSLWERLAEDGLPSLDTTYRPHVSLAVFDGDPFMELSSLVRGWASTVHYMTLELSHIGRFPETGVAFLGVTPTRLLLDLHEGLHVRLAAHPTGTGSDLYRPGSWVPHCTLAMRVADPDVSRLLSLVRPVKLPMCSTSSGARSEEVDPPSSSHRSPAIVSLP